MEISMAKKVSINPLNEEKFKSEITELKPLVLRELEYLKEGRPEPVMAEGLSDYEITVAEALIAMQKEVGYVSVRHLDENISHKLMYLGQKAKKSLSEIAEKLVKNINYRTSTTLQAQQYASLINDIDMVYMKCCNGVDYFPMTGLSRKSHIFLNNLRAGIPMELKFKLILQVFRPELEYLKIRNKDYTVVTRSAFYINDEQLKSLCEEIANKFADNSGNIDSIFAPENDKYLRNLITALKLNHITFEQFITTYSNLSYTRCYALPSEVALKHMAKAVYARTGTFRRLEITDQYFLNKLRTFMETAKIYTTRGLLDYWGIENDNMLKAKPLTKEELEEKQREVISELLKLFPDKKIDRLLCNISKNTYGKIQLLSYRFKYKSVNDYLGSLGFERMNSAEYRSSEKLLLSENDLLYYSFFGVNPSIEDVQKIMDEMSIELLDVDNYIPTYRKLVYSKKDHRQCLDTSVKFEESKGTEGSKPKIYFDE